MVVLWYNHLKILKRESVQKSQNQGRRIASAYGNSIALNKFRLNLISRKANTAINVGNNEEKESL